MNKDTFGADLFVEAIRKSPNNLKNDRSTQEKGALRSILYAQFVLLVCNFDKAYTLEHFLGLCIERVDLRVQF